MVEEKYYIKLIYVFLHLQADSPRYPQVAWQGIVTVLKKVNALGFYAYYNENNMYRQRSLIEI